jgi:hypothetical protein
MEILGLDPKITICKIAVLPIKLYPLFFFILALAHTTLKTQRFAFAIFFLEIKRVSDARTRRTLHNGNIIF